MNKFIMFLGVFLALQTTANADPALESLEVLCKAPVIDADKIEQAFVKFFYVDLAAKTKKGAILTTLRTEDFAIQEPEQIMKEFTSLCGRFDLKEEQKLTLIEKAQLYLYEQIHEKYLIILDHAKNPLAYGGIFGQKPKSKGHVSFVLESHGDADSLLWQAGAVLNKVKSKSKVRVYSEVFTEYEEPYYMDYLSFKILSAIAVDSLKSLGLLGYSNANVYFRAKLFALIENGNFKVGRFGRLEVREQHGISFMSIVGKNNRIPFYGWEPFNRPASYSEVPARDQNIADIISSTDNNLIIEMGSYHFPMAVISAYLGLTWVMRQNEKEYLKAKSQISLGDVFLDILDKAELREWAAKDLYSLKLAPMFSTYMSPKQSAAYFLSSIRDNIDIQSTKPIFEALKGKDWDVALHKNIFEMFKNEGHSALTQRSLIYQRYKKAQAFGTVCTLALAYWGFCAP